MLTENQNHADEETGLLGGASDTGVADDADGEASSETSKTDRETGAELNETCVAIDGRGRCVLEGWARL